MSMQCPLIWAFHFYLKVTVFIIHEEFLHHYLQIRSFLSNSTIYSPQQELTNPKNLRVF